MRQVLDRSKLRAPAGVNPGMELIAALFAGLLWQSGTEIAVGGGERGPWRQNESRYDYVDDPAVAVGARGEVAVAWVDQARKDVFFRRGGTTVNVSRSPHTFSWLPRLVISPGPPPVFHLLWQEIIFSGGSHGGDILYARSADGGRSFSAPLNLSRSAAGDGKGRTSREEWHNGSLDIAAGADGAVYAAWTEYEGRLLLAVSADRGRSFTPPNHVAGDDARPARAPALAIGPERTLYLAWTDGDIRLARSIDGGATFHTQQVVKAQGGYADAPKIAFDTQGSLHLAFSENGQVLYSRGLAAPRPIARGSFPSLALDAGGGVYLVWELERGLGFAASRNGGDDFSVTSPFPGSGGDGLNGGLQGKLANKLAVNAEGRLAAVHSSFRPGKDSRILLFY
ncbi:MAG: sialidase family protein [Betaproteobacteria bacterium]